LTLPLMLALTVPAVAQTGSPPAAEPVILTDAQGEYPLGLHLEILEDPGGQLTIEQVSSPEFDSRFVPSQVEVPNYGFTDSAYWVRFDVQNETSLTNHWLLEQGFANTQYVDLYTPCRRPGFAVKQTGTPDRPPRAIFPTAHHFQPDNFPRPANNYPLSKRRLDDPAAHPVDAESVPG
jgi:hypothetical protein